MPKPLIVVPMATKLHGEEYYLSVLEVFHRKLKQYALDFHEEVVTELDEVSQVAKRYADYLPVLLLLTGGTSRMVKKFVDAGAFDRVVILAHGEHNSLASAISARSKLEADGIWTWVFHCSSISDPECDLQLDRMVRILKAVTQVLEARIGLIGVEGKPETAENFEARFNAEIVTISMDEFESIVRSIDVEEARKVAEEISKLIKFESPKDKLTDVGQIYLAIKRLFVERKLDAVAIDCFPYLIKHGVTPCLALAKLNEEGYLVACEGDVQALLSMIISSSLTGYSGWIANAAMFKGNRGYFAHCTIALNMIRDGIAMPHFESGYPYALSGRLVHSIGTILSISSDFSLMAAAVVRVIQSGLLSYGMCRSQIVAEFDLNVEKLPLVAPANHHVFIPGDVREELKAIGALLGMDYVEYSELLAMV
ncbi:MAG TPA: fucose isomerase [Ignisphaera aggregans]|uniref:Fucose isomerase n=1 Tax=Ignisphaera aggregans TaxID=334771 RepID=A0A833DTW5_9CREN|nr:fucose isomerase [Ignisphaera aggregans]